MESEVELNGIRVSALNPPEEISDISLSNAENESEEIPF